MKYVNRNLKAETPSYPLLTFFCSNNLAGVWPISPETPGWPCNCFSSYQSVFKIGLWSHFRTRSQPATLLQTSYLLCLLLLGFSVNV